MFVQTFNLFSSYLKSQDHRSVFSKWVMVKSKFKNLKC
jgi:hypothetical protein